MSKLHLSSTVSLDFIIVSGSPVLGDHNTGIKNYSSIVIFFTKKNTILV
jgi:hypothetical protein